MDERVEEGLRLTTIEQIQQDITFLNEFIGEIHQKLYRITDSLDKRLAALESPYWGRSQQICSETWPAPHGTRHLCKLVPNHRQAHYCQCGANKL